MKKKYYRSSEHYRRRAQECRTLAEIVTMDELSEQMLKVAADYERLAACVDQVSNNDEPGAAGLELQEHRDAGPPATGRAL